MFDFTCLPRQPSMSIAKAESAVKQTESNIQQVCILCMRACAFVCAPWVC